MSLTSSDVNRIAQLAHLKLSPEQTDKTLEQLNGIFALVEKKITSSFDFEYNQIQSIVPNFCSVFKVSYFPKAIIMFYLSNNPCILNNVYFINRQNCEQLDSALKNCYSNSFPIANNPIQC